MSINTDYLINFFNDEPMLLEVKNRRNLKEVVDRIWSHDVEGLAEFYKKNIGTRYSSQGYLEEAKEGIKDCDKIVAVGYSTAISEAVKLVLQKRDVEGCIKKITTSYKDELLKVLKERGTVLHKELAATLQISPSGLNAVMKKMDEVDIKLVNVDKISKYKIYSLTPVAYQYLSEQEKKNEGDTYLSAGKRSETCSYVIRIHGHCDRNAIEREDSYIVKELRPNPRVPVINAIVVPKKSAYKRVKSIAKAMPHV